MKQQWTDDFLDAKRRQMDQEADTLLRTLHSEGYSQKDSIAVFDSLTKNRDPVPENLPEPLQEYFLQEAILPEWADRELIRQGEALFNIHGPMFVLALFCKALPECYAGKNGVQVLYSTGRLNEQRGQMNALQRRIAETAQFVIDVMAPGGLTSPEGRGVRTTQKVRLIHASIRAFIHGAPSWHTAERDAQGLPPLPWDSATLGDPINQEDLVGTLMAFSIVCLEGAEQLGVHLLHHEKKAYFYAWKIVGHILGIKPDLIPEDEQSARQLWAAIKRRQFGASAEGQALTHSLIDFLKYVIPFSFFDGLPEALMYHLMGKQTSGYLAVRRNIWYVLLFFFLDTVVSLLTAPFRSFIGTSWIFRKLTERISHKLMQTLITHWNDNKQVEFYIPPDLRGNWNLPQATTAAVTQ